MDLQDKTNLLRELYSFKSIDPQDYTIVRSDECLVSGNRRYLIEMMSDKSKTLRYDIFIVIARPPEKLHFEVKAPIPLLKKEVERVWNDTTHYIDLQPFRVTE